MHTYGGPCQDCGGINQGYMVVNYVWIVEAKLRHKGFTCLGCLETRLERKLERYDFTSAPINQELQVKKWLKEVY